MNPMEIFQQLTSGHMNPFQLIQTLRSSQGNPMEMMQQMFGNNPQFQRAVQMAQGKSPEELQQTVRNLCEQKGINFDQTIQQMSNMGLSPTLGEKSPKIDK